MVKRQPTNKSTKRRYILIASIVLAVLLVFDTLLVGNLAYYTKWVQCNAQPVVLNQPPKIGEGSYPPTYYARTNPNWFRSKSPLLNSNGASLHCSVSELAKSHEHLKVCESDSIIQMVSSLGFGDSCE